MPGNDERLQLLKDSLLARADRDAVSACEQPLSSGIGSAMSVALDSMSVTDPAQRANALEVIESVGDRDIVRPLLSMWESRASRTPTRTTLERLTTDPDEWIRACADLVAGTDQGGPMTQTLATLPLMERVLFLRKVASVRGASAARPEAHRPDRGGTRFADGETIAEQGDPGDAMHVIVSGEVSIDVDARRTAEHHRGPLIGRCDR